ncbi:hypothetical protein [Luteimonas sp. MC1750]|uniref:hypothetical protein n=1 Tax=Luteimonas sp. MC1750 TaxID=2799326 RepID=UPI0018F0C3CE|nr:hypothetical protein [Luteimonas sp. MC1750]MBJ6983987.1 hypothetical protein [Luteimonas sp. MC1750]QQO06799.1 hypothetical protein JGR68_05075 [Luteimonas sp. MC1750]
MNIDIYQQDRTNFIAVPHRHDLPAGWDRAQYFKTIDLLPGEIRIGMVGDAVAILEQLEQQGWSLV